MKRHIAILVLLCGILFSGATIVHGQAYPNKPIRIVTTAPGSGTDLIARLFAQGSTASLGQPVVVDNRGIIAVEIAARAPSDGYTLLVYTNPLWIMPLFRPNTPWDPVRDFIPVTLAGRQPSVLVVHPSVQVSSVGDLIAFAKVRPGQLNYGSGSTGAPTHLAAELFKAMARLNIVRVPFKGGGPAITALLSGEVQIMFAVPAAVMVHVRQSKLKALAVTSASPSALAPGLPTMAASGLPGYESIALSAVFVPTKTPAAIVDRLNREIVKVITGPDGKQRLFNSGIEAIGSSPQELAAIIKSEVARMAKVIADSGLQE